MGDVLQPGQCFLYGEYSRYREVNGCQAQAPRSKPRSQGISVVEGVVRRLSCLEFIAVLDRASNLLGAHDSPTLPAVRPGLWPDHVTYSVILRRPFVPSSNFPRPLWEELHVLQS